jgi:DnaJ-class molecular chaperone
MVKNHGGNVGLLSKKIDPKLAQDIEEDMNELDQGGKKPAKSTMKKVPCPDCKDSVIGAGLLDAFTQCPTCQGTGEVAELTEK